MRTFETRNANPTKDFIIQMYCHGYTGCYSNSVARCKLARGLLSGEYSTQPVAVVGNSPEEEGGEEKRQKEQDGIRPSMFKTLIGAGHREFSSKRQQVGVSLSLSHVLFYRMPKSFSFIFSHSLIEQK